MAAEKQGMILLVLGPEKDFCMFLLFLSQKSSSSRVGIDERKLKSSRLKISSSLLFWFLKKWIIFFPSCSEVERVFKKFLFLFFFVMAQTGWFLSKRNQKLEAASFFVEKKVMVMPFLSVLMVDFWSCVLQKLSFWNQWKSGMKREQKSISKR